MTFWRWLSGQGRPGQHNPRKPREDDHAADERHAADASGDPIEDLLEKAAIAKAKGDAERMRNASYKLLRFER